MLNFLIVNQMLCNLGMASTVFLDSRSEVGIVKQMVCINSWAVSCCEKPFFWSLPKKMAKVEETLSVVKFNVRFTSAEE